MPNKPLCHPMTLRKITQGGRVGGKKNKTVQYKISGVRLRWKMTWNETQNSRSLILEGVCCVWIALGKQTSRLTEITGSLFSIARAQLLGCTLSIADWFASGQLRFLNSTFTCIVYWQFVSVDKKSHLVECFTDQVKWTMISKVKYFLETFPVFGSYVLTPSIWKWMFITAALHIFPCFLISTICCDIKASIQFSHFLSFHCLSVKLCNELVAKIT